MSSPTIVAIALSFHHQAKISLRESRGALKNLRNGDWRDDNDGSGGGGSGGGGGGGGCKGEDGEEQQEEDEEDDEEDSRVEGTVAYLSPEVIKGSSAPTTFADAWALG